MFLKRKLIPLSYILLSFGVIILNWIYNLFDCLLIKLLTIIFKKVVFIIESV